MNPIQPVAATAGTLERQTYTPAQTAVILGTSRESVYRLLARNILPCVPGLRCKLISKAALEKFLNGSAA